MTYKLDTFEYCNGCGWANPAQAIDKCEFCGGSGVTAVNTKPHAQELLNNHGDRLGWMKPHAPDGELCWCGQYHPTDKDIGIDD